MYIPRLPHLAEQMIRACAALTPRSPCRNRLWWMTWQGALYGVSSFSCLRCPFLHQGFLGFPLPQIPQGPPLEEPRPRHFLPLEYHLFPGKSMHHTLCYSPSDLSSARLKTQFRAGISLSCSHLPRLPLQLKHGADIQKTFVE